MDLIIYELKLRLDSSIIYVFHIFYTTQLKLKNLYTLKYFLTA
jgi:hypothetical protein